MFILKNKKSKKSLFGFTLVELLVAIAIIGLLAAVIMPSFYSARKKSRVAKRVSDIKQVQAALEFYYAVNRSYPNTNGSFRGVCPMYGSYSANNVIPGLAPTYIAAVPTDPQGPGVADENCYLYYSLNGTDYAFLDYKVTELAGNQSKPNYLSYPELVDPARDGGNNNSIIDGVAPWSWKVSSPGGIGS